jgi:Thoeris protein ThsA, Macro domain
VGQTLLLPFNASVLTCASTAMHQRRRVRPEGKTKRYPIGTTVVLEFGRNKYLLFPLTKTDDNYIYTSPSLILEALLGLWKISRNVCNGYPISIPLKASGLAKSGLPPMRIIELILRSLPFEAKKQEVTNTVDILIHRSVYDDVDLKQILTYWR